ncbi:DUF7673 family protein [Cupriavidus necator]
MALPSRPKTYALTHNVPEHLVEAFLQTADEFLAAACGGQTSAQRAAEIRAQDRDAGLDSLMYLLEAAESDSGQACVVAAFLAGLYNGRDFPFDLTELRVLDADLFEHCLQVLRLDHGPQVEVHQYFPDGTARWQRLIAQWRLDPMPPAEPPPAPDARLAARYVGDGDAPGYRDMALHFRIDDAEPGREAPIEVVLAAGDTAALACDLLDVHRLVWRDSQRGPLDRQPGEVRPPWL